MKHVLAYLIAAGLMISGSSARARSLLDDPRLAPVRSGLSLVLSDLSRRGIDASPVRSKIREGLAKRVPAARLLQVVRRQGGYLREGNEVLQRMYGRKVPAGLLRAYSDARLSGVVRNRLTGLLKLLKTKNNRRWAVRMVDVLTDLVARRYSISATYGMIIKLVRKSRFKQVLQLRGTLVRLRKRYGLSVSTAGIILYKALVSNGVDLPRAVVSLSRHLPAVRQPATPTGTTTPSTSGEGHRP